MLDATFVGFLPLTEAAQRYGLGYGQLQKWFKRGVVRGPLSPVPSPARGRGEPASGDLHPRRPAWNDGGSRLRQPTGERPAGSDPPPCPPFLQGGGNCSPELASGDLHPGRPGRFARRPAVLATEVAPRVGCSARPAV